MQTRFQKRIAAIGVIVAIGTSCSINQSKDKHDSDTGTPDGGQDAGAQKVDPEIEWQSVPTGSFTFGSPSGAPCIKPTMEKEVPVTLTHPFQIAKTELTQRQWQALGFTVPPNLPMCDDCPIMYLNWYETLAWCNALSRFEGLEECYDLSSCSGEIGNGCPDGYEMCGGPIEAGNAFTCTGTTRRFNTMYECTGYRLPTAAEWEYAAQAGTTTNTYNGDLPGDLSDTCSEQAVLDDIAWYCANTGSAVAGDQSWKPEFAKPVGQKQANPWGLCDMLGNAGEWVDYVSTGLSLDTNEGKPGEALVDPMGEAEVADSRGDVRGGWYFSPPCYDRAASQFDITMGIRESSFGFRPVRTLPATSTDAGVK